MWKVATSLVSVALVVLSLWACGISPARGLALLVLTQFGTVLSMGLFSRERTLSPTLLLLGVATLAIQFVPGTLPPLASLTASMTIGYLTYAILARHPRLPLASVDGKLIVVTGCSTGIGLETARQLLSLGGGVVWTRSLDSRLPNSENGVRRQGSREYVGGGAARADTDGTRPDINVLS